MKVLIVCVVTIYLMTIAQLALAPRIVIGGAEPDFMLIGSICLGFVLSRIGSIYTGFTVGLVQGVLVGANLSQFVVTRMLTCYFAARMNESEIEIGPLLGILAVALLSFLASVIFMFFSPPASISAYLSASFFAALYNGLLALPLLATLRAVLGRRTAGV